MLLVLIIIVGYVLMIVVAEVIKDMHTRAKDRRDDEIMAAYRRTEDEYYHRQCLDEIDRTVRKTCDEMARIAADAQGGVVDGTCREVNRETY